MIRLFTKLCKHIFLVLSDKALFQKTTDDFKYHDAHCPKCGAIGRLKPYGDYSRDLVSYKNGKVVYSRVKPLRFKCESCVSTHALLPDNIIPYSPYSLHFKITVLLAYYERKTTVAEICERFLIAVSTLYAWKELLGKHKDLFLGALASQKKAVAVFLHNIYGATSLSDYIRDFFMRYAFSFLQNKSTVTTRLRPP
jgi:hypothetical protein